MAKQKGFIFNLLKGSFLTEENSQKKLALHHFFSCFSFNYDKQFIEH